MQDCKHVVTINTMKLNEKKKTEPHTHTQNHNSCEPKKCTLIHKHNIHITREQ